MNRGGFDVIIGNPPYVEYSKVRKEYTVKSYQTERCGNLYAMMIERSYDCLRQDGRFGMIVQISYSCTDRMESIQQLCLSCSGLWLSHFDGRPAKLFDGLGHMRSTIVLSAMSSRIIGAINSTAHNRWYTESRPHLFNTISFGSLSNVTGVPRGTIAKTGPLPASAILERLVQHCPLRNSLTSSGIGTVYFHNAPLYWVRAMDFVPYFSTEHDGKQISSHVKTLSLSSIEDTQVVIAVLNSSLFYWWFLLLSNCRDLSLREIISFPIGLDEMVKDTKNKLIKLASTLMISFKENSQRKTRHQVATGRVIYDEFYQKHSKPIVDEIDRILAKHYGFTNEELDFIINYDIKYRMGLG